MPDSLPSLELLAAELRAERDALVRHADAVDAKAGIVLGLAGAVAAIATQRLSPARAPGVAIAVLAALVALSALMPQRFPAWNAAKLQSYLKAEPERTKLMILNATTAMVIRLKDSSERKAARLRIAVLLLALAVVTTSIGTTID